MIHEDQEKLRQEEWGKLRSDQFLGYRTILAHYCGLACLEECKGPSVLDLACGEGRMLGLFLSRYNRVVGVDASGFALSKAREKHPDCELHECLIENLELDEKFDDVLLINVLEHVRDPVAVLNKSASFLKDDGRLMIQVPNAEALNRRLALSMGSLKYLEELSTYDLEITGHRRYYTMDALISDVREVGLCIIKEGGVFLKMLSTAQMDWFLENGLWKEGGFGWGRVGSEKEADWRAEFCRASYELGKQYPRDCNVIYLVCEH